MMEHLNQPKSSQKSNNQSNLSKQKQPKQTSDYYQNYQTKHTNHKLKQKTQLSPEKLQENSQPTQSKFFNNPVCQSTYKALPRIYGCSSNNNLNLKKRISLNNKSNRSPNQYPHHCCLNLSNMGGMNCLNNNLHPNKARIKNIPNLPNASFKIPKIPLNGNDTRVQNQSGCYYCDTGNHKNLNNLNNQQVTHKDHPNFYNISSTKRLLSLPKTNHSCNKKYCVCYNQNQSPAQRDRNKRNKFYRNNLHCENQDQYASREKSPMDSNYGNLKPISKRNTQIKYKTGQKHGNLSNIKLPQLIKVNLNNSDSSIEKKQKRHKRYSSMVPDDIQSRHKVINLRTESSNNLAMLLPSKLADLQNKNILNEEQEESEQCSGQNQIIQNDSKQNSKNKQNRLNQNKQKIQNNQQPQSNVTNLSVETAKFRSIHMESQKQIQMSMGAVQKQQLSQKVKNQKIDQSVQVQLSQQLDSSQFSKNQKDIQNSNNAKAFKNIKYLKNKEKQRYKPKFRQGRYNQKFESNEDEQDNSRNYNTQEGIKNRQNKKLKKNTFEAQPQQSNSNFEQNRKRKSSDSGSVSSLSSLIFKSNANNKKNTQFHNLNQKGEHLSKISPNKKSRVKSILSNGLFRIPQEDQYVSYISNYKPMNKDFKIKQIAKRNNFKIVPFNKGVYFGQVQNDMKQGQGLILTQKQVFEGKFKNNYRFYGSQRNIDGIYKGQYLNGLRSGHGTFQWNNGQTFQGQWKQGAKNGFGIWKSPKGDYYQGQWLMNRQQGKGVFKHKTSTYRGEFKDFLKHGKGQQKFSNGDKYEGQYYEGKPHGKGMYQWAQGGYYIGSFEKGMRQGQGKWVDSSGNVYQGSFKNDFKHGQGIQIFKSGERYEGIYNEGVQQQGKIYGTDGSIIQIK